MIKTLVIDDDVMVRSVLMLILGEPPFDSDFASNAEEALGLIDRKNYDVVLTDYHMPGMDGIELIGHIRQKSPHTAVVLMSGCPDPEALRLSGADKYLSKPFSASAVKESVDGAFRERCAGGSPARSSGG